MGVGSEGTQYTGRVEAVHGFLGGERGGGLPPLPPVGDLTEVERTVFWGHESEATAAPSVLGPVPRRSGREHDQPGGPVPRFDAPARQVSSPEAGRVFPVAADPADRPRKIRRTVRVILINAEEQTLLFEDSDPGVPGTRWWVQPGGGIDPGETNAQAAVREINEETGYLLGEDELIGPIAHRHVIHGYSDLVIDQDETFYLARVQNFDVDISLHTEEEQLTLQSHRWWSREDLERTVAAIWPRELVELWALINTPERWPLEMGEQEESTVLDVSRS